jgi:hypothetical protein
MYRTKLGVVTAAIALSALVPVSTLLGQEQAQFLIPMFDKDGAPVASFGPDDLTVFEDGKEAKILKVEPRDQPVRVTLALDNGRLMGDSLVHLRAAAGEFIKALPASSEVSLMTTAPQPRFALKLSKDRGALLKRIDTIAPDGSPGRFIEAIQDVAQEWSRQPGDYTPILVIVGSTYAAEYVNKAQLEEAIGRFMKARAVIHVVMVKPTAATEGDAQELIGERVARDTRGRYEAIGSHLQFPILSELAAEVTKGSGRQFLVTVQRPAGATGRLGSLSMSPSAGFKPGRVTRIP